MWLFLFPPNQTRLANSITSENGIKFLPMIRQRFCFIVICPKGRKSGLTQICLQSMEWPSLMVSVISFETQRVPRVRRLLLRLWRSWFHHFTLSSFIAYLYLPYDLSSYIYFTFASLGQPCSFSCLVYHSVQDSKMLDKTKVTTSNILPIVQILEF